MVDGLPCNLGRDGTPRVAVRAARKGVAAQGACRSYPWRADE